MFHLGVIHIDPVPTVATVDHDDHAPFRPSAPRRTVVCQRGYLLDIVHGHVHVLGYQGHTPYFERVYGHGVNDVGEAGGGEELCLGESRAGDSRPTTPGLHKGSLYRLVSLDVGAQHRAEGLGALQHPLDIRLASAAVEDHIGGYEG